MIPVLKFKNSNLSLSITINVYTRRKEDNEQRNNKEDLKEIREWRKITNNLGLEVPLQKRQTSLYIGGFKMA